MSNIAKHSDADKISVILREHPAFYQMTVEDNGTVGRKDRADHCGRKRSSVWTERKGLVFPI